MALLKTGGLRWERFVNFPHGPVFLLPFGVEKDKGMHRDLQLILKSSLALGDTYMETDENMVNQVN